MAAFTTHTTFEAFEENIHDVIRRIMHPSMRDAAPARFERYHAEMKHLAISEFFFFLRRTVRRDYFGALANLLAWYGPIKCAEVQEYMAELEAKRADAQERLEQFERLQEEGTAPWTLPLDTRASIEAEVARWERDTGTCIMILERAEEEALEAHRIFLRYLQGQTWPPD